MAQASHEFYAGHRVVLAKVSLTQHQRKHRIRRFGWYRQEKSFPARAHDLLGEGNSRLLRLGLLFGASFRRYQLPEKPEVILYDLGRPFRFEFVFVELDS